MFNTDLYKSLIAGVIFHSDPIDETIMQAIAAENNLSETAFINTQNDNQIRFFTPELEVDLCGHATLASAFVFFNYLDKSHDQITFLSKRGQLIADRAEKGIKLTLPKDNPESYAEIDLFFYLQLTSILTEEVLDCIFWLYQHLKIYTYL